MATDRTIDPRRLLTLAAAARKAGITRLRLADGTEFELGAAPAKAPTIARDAVEAVEKVGSLESLRKRFGSATARQ